MEEGGPESAAEEVETAEAWRGGERLRPAAGTHKGHVWTWDFVFGKTTGGSQLKWLSIADEFTRECLTLKCDRASRAGT